MTIDERMIMDIERERRKQTTKDSIREHRLEIAFGVALLLGFIVFMVWWNVAQPLRERAAYLEGRYNVSHAVAMQMAETEVAR